MCRWMAWHGQPVLIEELLFKTKHGIVDQSLHSRLGAEPTNGDGFGLGWYGPADGPAVYRSVAPAWADANLRELAAHVESPLFMAHVRAAIGSPVQQTNCHPFRRGAWLFVHNGYLDEFHLLRRDLMLADRSRASSPRSMARRHRGRLPPRADASAWRRTRRRARADGRPDRGDGARRHGIETRCRRASASRTANASGRCATRPRSSLARCSPRPTWTSVRRLYPDNPRIGRAQ